MMWDLLGYLGILLFFAVAIWQLNTRLRLIKFLIKYSSRTNNKRINDRRTNHKR
jgi:hypothetical protein